MTPEEESRIVAKVNAKTGTIMYKVTPELLDDIEQEAKAATGIDKYNLYKKLRIFKVIVESSRPWHTGFVIPVKTFKKKTKNLPPPQALNFHFPRKKLKLFDVVFSFSPGN